MYHISVKCPEFHDTGYHNTYLYSKEIYDELLKTIGDDTSNLFSSGK